MTQQSRFAMLVGLLFIIMFGLVISSLAGYSYSYPSPKGRGDQPEAQRYAPVRVVEPPPPGDVPPEALAGDGGGRPPLEIAHRPADPCSEVVVEVVRRPDAEKAADPPPVRPGVRIVDPPAGPVAPPAGPVALPPAPARKHLVKAKETLRKIARQEYGPENEKQYVLILQANKDQLEGDDTLQVGMTLVIPPLPASVSRPPAASPPPAVAGAPAASPAPAAPPYLVMGMDELRRAFGSPAPSPAPVVDRPSDPARQYYVIRRGDSLAKIAKEKLHDESRAAVQKLYKANKDKLSDPDDLPVGMKLVIPI